MTILGLSYDRPKLCSAAQWDPIAVTVINASVITTLVRGIFITKDNIIYTADRGTNQIFIWSGENMTLIKNISNGLSAPRGIFVMSNGDFYVNHESPPASVDKWAANATAGIVAIHVTSNCLSIFIDIDNFLYCTMEAPDQVVKQSLNSAINTSIIVAGNGTAGSGPTMLSGPRGILVDNNLNLYVADGRNHRIQFFRPGDLNGITVPINGTNGLLTLNNPTDVTLDADGYLFIADYLNHRILGSDINGFRCIAGCTNTSGSASNQLSSPHSFSFDSFGNIFVLDLNNMRVQKFVLLSNGCGESSTTDMQPIISSEYTSQTSFLSTSHSISM